METTRLKERRTARDRLEVPGSRLDDKGDGHCYLVTTCRVPPVDNMNPPQAPISGSSRSGEKRTVLSAWHCAQHGCRTRSGDSD
jgi:hypothetical protein